MKKFLIILCIMLLTLSACGAESSSLSIEDIEKAIQETDPNFAFDSENKPIYALIGASDGWIGYFEGTYPVKIYQYKDKSAYKKAVKDFEMIEDWPTKGNFMLECSNNEIVTIFESLSE